LIFLLVIVLFPIVLVFGGIVALMALFLDSSCWRDHFRHSNCLVKIGVCLTMLTISILLDPICIALILLAIIPVLIYCITMYTFFINKIS